MSIEEFAWILFEINKYSGLPGIILFLILLTRKKKQTASIAFWILLASFLGDFLSLLYVKYIEVNTHGIGTSWLLMNFILCSWLYVQLTPKRKKLICITLILFGIGTIISFFFYSFTEANPFTASYSSVALTLFSLLTFHSILKSNPHDNLLKYPVFWINSAIFLFSSVTLLDNIFTSYLVFELKVTDDLYAYIAIIYISMNMLKNFILFYAFYLVWKGYPDYIQKPDFDTSSS